MSSAATVILAFFAIALVLQSAYFERKVRNMATQAEVDALAAQMDANNAANAAAVAVIAQETSELGTALTAIQEEVTALGNAHPELDLTALTDKINAGTAAATSLTDATTALQAAADAVEAQPSTPTP